VAEPVPSPPQPPAIEQLQWAVGRRSETDYVFNFWTAFGWTLLTFGIFGLYVVYRLFWRSVEHNKRRLALLEAATALAWERTTAAGRAEELTPRFQSLGVHVNELRRLTGEFRDPALWTVISAFTGGIGQIIGYILLDQDLVRHESAELAAEHELAAIFGALGAGTSLPSGIAPKQRHNYVGRVIATLVSCGIYGLWWLADMMREGNNHQHRNHVSEDALVAAAQTLARG
jgi:hypothetical protein